MADLNTQELMAQLLRRQQQGQAFQGANADAHQYDQLAAVTQMANNPGMAAAAKLSAMNAQNQYKPLSLGPEGFALPASGEFVASPMHEDKLAEDRLLRRTLAQQMTDWREQEIQRKRDRDISEDARKRDAVDANGVLKMSVAATMSGRANDAAQLRQDRFDNLKNQQQQHNVQQFGEKLNKYGMPQIADAVSGINSMMEVPQGSLAGVGYGAKTLAAIPGISDITVGEQGKANRATIQKLVNAMTLTEAGKAVTKNEEARQAIVNMSANNYNEKDFRNAWENVIRPAIENVRANAHKSFSPSVVEDYVNNAPGGFDPRQSFIPQKSLGLNLPPGFKLIGPAP